MVIFRVKTSKLMVQILYRNINVSKKNYPDFTGKCLCKDKLPCWETVTTETREGNRPMGTMYSMQPSDKSFRGAKGKIKRIL